MMSHNRDPRREIAEQEAFEDAERLRAAGRAAAIFDSFADSSPVSVELFALDVVPVGGSRYPDYVAATVAAAEQALARGEPVSIERPSLPAADTTPVTGEARGNRKRPAKQ